MQDSSIYKLKGLFTWSGKTEVEYSPLRKAVNPPKRAKNGGFLTLIGGGGEVRKKNSDFGMGNAE